MTSEATATASVALAENEFLVSEVPEGSARLVADVVAVFHPVKRGFCATQAQCTHKGGPLDQGEFDGTTVTCPWHGGQFDVTTGDVLRGPPERSLETYQVQVDGEVGRVEPE